ncbi:unnamed protein product [Caenorhabditis sp. 36 PRJEB53466]|nr:unnamed protein product [Caenorhabditis sp. 36 PRJEB53466]
MDEIDDFFGNNDLDKAETSTEDNNDEENAGEGDGKRTIQPKLLRKKITNPRLALNESMLTGPKGIPAMKEVFKDFKPNPKDNPYVNLEKMMKKYAYWGHLMFPKMKTEDVLNRVETLGTRRQVEEEVQKKTSKNGIIDDGADEDGEPMEAETEGLFGDEKELEVPTSTKSPPKKPAVSPAKDAEQIDPDEEDEYRMMEEEKLREEQEAKAVEAEDELLADFDLNNDW